jgi:hypothetical protein
MPTDLQARPGNQTREFLKPQPCAGAKSRSAKRVGQCLEYEVRGGAVVGTHLAEHESVRGRPMTIP